MDNEDRMLLMIQILMKAVAYLGEVSPAAAKEICEQFSNLIKGASNEK